MKRSATGKVKTFGASFYVALLMVLCGLGGCTPPNRGQDSTNLYRLPWRQADGSYKLSDVKIETLAGRDQASGTAARILVDPWVNGNDGLDAPNPAIHVIQNADGVNVPADYNSMAALTLYAHIERLKALDEKTGMAQAMKWPAVIAIESAQLSKTQHAVVNNALYDGHLDALLIVPYRAGALPLSMNAGVIGHEHFHKIFQSHVLNQIGQSKKASAFDCGIVQNTVGMLRARPDNSNIRTVDIEAALDQVTVQDYNAFFIRGLNEGLADVWGWIYSGDPAFVAHSLPITMTGDRRLDLSPMALPNERDLRMNLLDQDLHVVPIEMRVRMAYGLIGTAYARFFYRLAQQVFGKDQLTDNERFQFAQILMDALDGIAKVTAQQFTQKRISPHEILNQITLKMKNFNQPACASLQSFARRGTSFISMDACAHKTVQPVVGK